MMITVDTGEAGLTATCCLQISVETHRSVGFCALSAEAPEEVQQSGCAAAIPKAFHKDAVHSQFYIGYQWKKRAREARN